MNPNYLIDPQNPDVSMMEIASDLMNKWLIKVGSSLFRICEVEFYYDHASNPDAYIHGKEIQKQYGQWYFHGSGLDITLGQGDTSASILIRALYKVSGDQYIYGPLNAVNELFAGIGRCACQTIEFGLVPDNGQNKEERPIAARRVGLNPEKDPVRFRALYRFLIMPKEKHADKTGLEQVMRASGHYSEQEIRSIWG